MFFLVSETCSLPGRFNPELGSFRHFPSPPLAGAGRKPGRARVKRARALLPSRQSVDLIGINSLMGSFRHLLATPVPLAYGCYKAAAAGVIRLGAKHLACQPVI